MIVPMSPIQIMMNELTKEGNKRDKLEHEMLELDLQIKREQLKQEQLKSQSLVNEIHRQGF